MDRWLRDMDPHWSKSRRQQRSWAPPALPRRHGLGALILALALVVGGCGAGAAPQAPASAPSPDTQGQPSAMGEAEEMPGYGVHPGQTGTASPPPKEPWVAQPERRDPTSAAEALDILEEDEAMLLAALDDTKQATALARDPSGACRRVCVAIASMRRSVDAVCRLAGDDDDRCARARSTLDRSEGRVQDAGCGCPSD